MRHEIIIRRSSITATCAKPRSAIVAMPLARLIKSDQPCLSFLRSPPTNPRLKATGHDQVFATIGSTAQPGRHPVPRSDRDRTTRIGPYRCHESAQWRKVADQLRPKVQKLAKLMDEAEPDVLA
jgi:hypothetical protein